VSNCGKCGRELLADANRSLYMNRENRLCHRICPKRPKRKRGIPTRTRYSFGPRVDADATLARCTDPDSRIFLDGRESLRGDDYKQRVREVLERDGGKCQWPFHFIGICGASATDVDHIVKRSKGRDDRASNLRSLCRTHHDLRHPEFKPQFRRKE
jgi:HNH endonuclease